MTVEVPRKYRWVVGDLVLEAFCLRGVDYSAGPARLALCRDRDTAALISLDDDPGGGITLSYVTDTTYQTSNGPLTGNWTLVSFTFTVTEAMVGRGKLFLEIGSREQVWAAWVVEPRGVPA